MTRLTDLDPPSDPDPGYKPDPLGGQYHRMWDGTNWLARVGSPDNPVLTDGQRIGTAMRDYGALVVIPPVFWILETHPIIKAAIAMAVGLATHYVVKLVLWRFPQLRPRD